MTRSLVNGDVSMMTSWNGRAAHADTLGLGELARNPRVTLSLALALTPTLTLTLAPKVHDDVRVGGWVMGVCDDVIGDVMGA